jgi:hypothetical protein
LQAIPLERCAPKLERLARVSLARLIACAAADWSLNDFFRHIALSVEDTRFYQIDAERKV